MKRITASMISLMMAFTLCVSAFAESTSTDTATSLAEAQSAYENARKLETDSDYEAELKAMVEAGSLTQEQADLLMNAQRQAASAAVDQTSGATRQSRGGARGNASAMPGQNNGPARQGGNRLNGFGKAAPSVTDNASGDTESDALREAQDAYRAARLNSRIAEYETELAAMVEAGSLTQEQADLLMSAVKEAQARANGTCPACGYQYQTNVSGMQRGFGGGRGLGMNR